MNWARVAASAPSNSVTPTEPAQVAPTVPVPTLPSFLLLALGGLLAALRYRGSQSLKLISCKREWHLPRMNRPDPMPPWEWRRR